MHRQKILKAQQLKFTGLNLLAFTFIFAIFSLIVFFFVQNTLLSKPDRELKDFKERISSQRQVPEERIQLDERKEDKNFKPTQVDGPPPNPRMTIVKWDENGNILNKEQIGISFYENFLQKLKLKQTSINKIVPLELGGEYHFRSLLFKVPAGINEDAAYIQLLANVDTERNILSSFVKLIVFCSLFFILLSIGASLLLSRKTMQPIIRSWKKQSEFVENASHELRTPLSIIQNKLELLLRKPDASIASEIEPIALSLSETRRLSRLTSDLLTLARADSAELQIIREPIDLNSFIDNLATPFMEIAESQDKQLLLELAKTAATISADPQRLHQLLVILLDNAIKYTEPGDSISIIIGTNDRSFTIEVRDTGIGIDAQSTSLIFDRFYREDAARRRETGGSGLGLSIAQWIVEAHKGAIEACPNKPKGTIFKIVLPK